MIEIRSLESWECLGDIWVQSAMLGTVKMYKLALRKESLTRQFMPSLNINRPETLKKVASDTGDARARVRIRRRHRSSELATWKRVLRKEARVTQAFTSDVIPCYRKRGAGEPIFALRKASLDILFSDVRFNRAALVSRPRASEVQRPKGRTLLVFSLSEPLV